MLVFKCWFGVEPIPSAAQGAKTIGLEFSNPSQAPQSEAVPTDWGLFYFRISNEIPTK